jgi:spermidine/putrescine transport system ATP-binding protein
MVSHDINDALLLSDWVILLNQGFIVQEGEIHSLMNQPKNAFVKSFFLNKEEDHD